MCACVCVCPLPACLLRALTGLFSSSRGLFQTCLGSALSVTKRGAKFLLHSRCTTKKWSCSGTKWRGHHMIPVMHHFLSPCSVPSIHSSGWETLTEHAHTDWPYTQTDWTHISTEHNLCVSKHTYLLKRLHTPTKNTHNGRTHTPAERGANGHTVHTGHWPLGRQRKSGSWMATFQYNNIKVSTKICVTFYFTVHYMSGVSWFKKHGKMIMIHLLRNTFKSTNMYHVVWSTGVSKCVAFLSKAQKDFNQLRELEIDCNRNPEV